MYDRALGEQFAVYAAILRIATRANCSKKEHRNLPATQA